MAYSGALDTFQKKRREETKKPSPKIPPVNDVFNEFERNMLRTVGYSKKSEAYNIVFNRSSTTEAQRDAFRKKTYGSVHYPKRGDVDLEKIHIPSPVYGQGQMNDLIGEYDRYLKTGSRFPEPTTWITKRRDYMKKRYTGSPSGGFSGTLGGGGMKKQLLGA